jgi:glucan phosphoethanolaminetransferase (alkaline phosphatase superfamily)
MGEIIFWGIIRTAILIVSLWFSHNYVDYKFWWTITIISIYAVVLHPAFIQYQLFLQKNKPVLEDSLCSICKHFDETAVLCSKYDEHPEKNYIPCDKIDWEPKN